MKLEFSRQIFEKSPNTKFHENQSIASRFVSRQWTDRRDEVACLNYAKAPKKRVG
jgi:hypothetical protein